MLDTRAILAHDTRGPCAALAAAAAAAASAASAPGPAAAISPRAAISAAISASLHAPAGPCASLMPLGSLALGGVGDFSAENGRGRERSMAALEPVCTVYAET